MMDTKEDTAPYCDGPSRETSVSVLRNAIKWHESKLAGMKRLLEIVEKMENGSPEEEVLWRLLQNNHNTIFG